MGFPWDSHQNGSDNDCVVGMGVGIKVWEWKSNGNEFPLQLFNVRDSVQ